MLVEILSLESTPELRPAYLEGFRCKLWGQYPALLPGESENKDQSANQSQCARASQRVEGAAWRVRNAGDAEKLASYETRHYMPVPCEIQYLDGKAPVVEGGYVFLFVGNQKDLSEGEFDLRVWLGRVGRLAAWDALDAKKVG